MFRKRITEMVRSHLWRETKEFSVGYLWAFAENPSYIIGQLLEGRKVLSNNKDTLSRNLQGVFTENNPVHICCT